MLWRSSLKGITQTISVSRQPTIPVVCNAYQISETQHILYDVNLLSWEKVVHVGEKLNAYRILAGKPGAKKVVCNIWAKLRG
jgi:hypothetical protein